MNINKLGNDLNQNYRQLTYISKVNVSPLQWEEVIQFNNYKIDLAFHVAASIDNYIYIHGGVKEKKSSIPTNDFYRLDLNLFEIQNITTDDSPFLSQHACVVLINRYFILIGGWNGHYRTSSVHVYDCQNMNWLKTPSISGFPDKAGLSGHTANVAIKTKLSFPEIIVIGREGSIKTQRRFGNGYRLSSNSNLSHFVYEELKINLDSRSYHCTNIINNKLFVVGGRDDKVIDIHTYKSLISSCSCIEVSNFIEKIKTYSLSLCPLTGRRKAARRGHCIVSGKNGFVILGGSTFVNSNESADCAGFLYTDYGAVDTNFYFLGLLRNARLNGACCVAKDGHAYYHGGIGVDGKLHSELLILKLIE